MSDASLTTDPVDPAYLGLLQMQIKWMESLSILMKVLSAGLVLLILSPLYKNGGTTGEQALVLLFAEAMLIVAWAGDNYFYGRRSGYISLFDRARVGDTMPFDMNEKPFRNTARPWVRDGLYGVAIIALFLVVLMRW